MTKEFQKTCLLALIDAGMSGCRNFRLAMHCSNRVILSLLKELRESGEIVAVPSTKRVHPRGVIATQYKVVR